MIYGIGTDIVEIDRIEKLLTENGERFCARILTPQELEHMNTIAQRAAFVAKRFAAKEAFVKALGTGFGTSVAMHHVGVINDSLGKPTLQLDTSVQQLLAEKKITRTHLSIADEKTHAIAFVVLECD